MNLKQLAKASDYTPDQQRYFLEHLKEIDALDFVQELCNIAYSNGVIDGQDSYIES